ncbi:dihydrodipicolinate synthase family protein [Rhodopirellula sp. MGV]|uniref:dihydrodipicolinate synthase family protein n=1 Tax=Rhodopirellula sp. MGV TaxID=2023130 RepID=UPI000B97B983|nr:dihydrodipicolinate synthase family protein [Rhodopirellula sp. MGV]OYP38837.1 dihydrodipicolinate synthase family protein [Rhodopirellula sp. MGV]PNY37647.1 dihydrodipicolinate synthase family protein [Rhodopirellula baltica]
MTAPISGILTPNITPVDRLGRVDEDTLRAYVDWLIEKGVDGLYPNGSTGEFVRFTPEERRRIVQVVTEQTAGRVPILAGAAEANVKETIEACEAYGAMGVRAVAIVAPFYYRLSDQGVYAYFREIADTVSVDVTLYNIPLFASPISVDTVVRLASECPRVVGIKDSSGDLPNMMRMIAQIRPLREDFCFLTGWDAALVPMLVAGANGGTNATSGVVPELTRAIHRTVVAGDIKQAMKLQYQLLPLFDAMISIGEFPEGFRAGARSRGWDLGPGRVPLSEQQKSAVASAQRQIDSLLDQYVESPKETVPVQAVEKIVAQVISQLRLQQ